MGVTLQFAEVTVLPMTVLITWRPSSSRSVSINVLPSIEVYELVLVSQPALACMLNVQKGGKGKDR